MQLLPISERRKIGSLESVACERVARRLRSLEGGRRHDLHYELTYIETLAGERLAQVAEPPRAVGADRLADQVMEQLLDAQQTVPSPA